MSGVVDSGDDAKLGALRELIPAAAAGIYLDTANRGPMSSEVAAAMREADDWELRVGRVWEGRDEDVIQRHEEARAVLAALLGAELGSITIAPSLESAAALAQRVLSIGLEDIERLVDPATGDRVTAFPQEAGPTVIDVSLAVGAVPVSVTELDADAVVFAVDRWLLGPESVAALWLRQPLPGVGLALARTSLIGLARSVGWLEMYVGLEWVFDRTARLARRLYNALNAAQGVETVTSGEALAAIVVFRVSAWSNEEAIDELRRRAFALIGTTRDGEAIRASVAWFNTEEELDRFAAAVAEIAQHTPETLPRRPLLVIQ
jgi:selenocysteine lyase/cysteine desulfurase